MKRSGSVKFPSSVQLFKFCHRALVAQRGGKKVHDQEVGAILGFNPSDCSHWKRGEKNVKSVFALAKLAETLKVEIALIHDLASGAITLDEASFEWSESNSYRVVLAEARQVDAELQAACRGRVENFVTSLHQQCSFSTAPLYIPEVMRFFSFVATQPTEMLDKLSRILRIKPGQYSIQFRKGDLRPQTRLSLAKDLARVIFEGERQRFPELGEAVPELVKFEELLFAANLLVPRGMMRTEIGKFDSRRNVVAELAALFWVPKSLICFQLRDALGDVSEGSADAGTRLGEKTAASVITAS